MAYASDEKLPLSSLELTDIALELGDTRFPAVRLSVVVSGTLESLLGSLRVLDSYPTSSVVNIEFFRTELGPDTWGLSFVVDVVYQAEEV